MQKQQGFSLIELLVVIGIIGALTAIAIPQYQKYQDKAKVTAAIATLTNMRAPVEAHILEKGSFPEDLEDLANLGIPEDVKTEEKGLFITVTELPDTFTDKKVTLTRSDAGLWSCTQPLEEKVSNCEGSGTGSDTGKG
ncbi:pilin [Salinivibrio sp. EAGSL]|uniref:pilin n=1 Tax=Salinivibrio sp. EAGSL TaxID=2738468 RepID=UPI00158AB2CF|nr:pilin [Salinivibrio sp. EAGSL]NUY56979.1 pilin [Salinivibrio sp. EAGSL]